MINLPDISLKMLYNTKGGRYQSYFIKGLNLMFDCGLATDLCPKYIFISHCHADHCQGIPNVLLNGRSTIVCPTYMKENLESFISSFFSLTKNYGAGCKHSNTVFPCDFVTIGAKRLEIEISKRTYFIEPIECKHSVFSLGYGLIEIKNVVKEEYRKKTNVEIAELIKKNPSIIEKTEKYLIIFLGDTTTKVFSNNNIFKYRYIVIECTYIFDGDVLLAKKNKHVHWNDLRDIIIEHPANKFLIGHFSAKYSKSEIDNFFKEKIMDNMHLLL